MSHENLMFSTDARTKVLKGATQIADVVRVTLGPKSLTEATLTELPEPKQAAALPATGE